MDFRATHQKKRSPKRSPKRGRYRPQDKKGQVEEAKPCFSERVSRALDIAPDILPGGTLIELRGRSAMTVRGSGRILCYTPRRICVELGGRVLSVCGRRLFCSAYHRGTLGVEGEILALSFCSFEEYEKYDEQEKNEKNDGTQERKEGRVP